ncbi:MAG: hypothetical protein OEZ44_09100 [Candidatus Bathyarchaeota archaeon]|nr:hypothetical protein [Candidatus Bathyarchaeota archaeon]
MLSSSETVMEQTVEIPKADSDAPNPMDFDDPTSVFYRMLELLPEVLDCSIGLVE